MKGCGAANAEWPTLVRSGDGSRPRQLGEHHQKMIELTISYLTWLTVMIQGLSVQFRCSNAAELICQRPQPAPVYADSPISINLASPTLDLSIVDNITLGGIGLNGLTFSTAARARPVCMDLSSNGLTAWPLFNGSARHLLYLNLSRNQIDGWDIEAVRELGNLRILDLSNNQIRSLQLASMVHLKKLEIIFLNGNPMHIFSALKHIPKLEVVVLSREYWYAVNNIDFGVHPIDLVINGSLQARQFQFKCSNRLDAPGRVNISGCSQLRLDSEVISPPGSCLTCYECHTPLFAITSDGAGGRMFPSSSGFGIKSDRRRSGSSSSAMNDNGSSGGGGNALPTCSFWIISSVATCLIIIVISYCLWTVIQQHHQQQRAPSTGTTTATAHQRPPLPPPDGRGELPIVVENGLGMGYFFNGGSSLGGSGGPPVNNNNRPGYQNEHSILSQTYPKQLEQSSIPPFSGNGGNSNNNHSTHEPFLASPTSSAAVYNKSNNTSFNHQHPFHQNLQYSPLHQQNQQHQHRMHPPTAGGHQCYHQQHHHQPPTIDEYSTIGQEENHPGQQQQPQQQQLQTMTEDMSEQPMFTPRTDLDESRSSPLSALATSRSIPSTPGPPIRLPSNPNTTV